MFWGSFICLLVALILVNFSAGAVTFQLRAWTDRHQDWAQVRSDLSIAINDTLARENIAIA
jgi:small-conductance mechanosensitive channel